MIISSWLMQTSNILIIVILLLLLLFLLVVLMIILTSASGCPHANRNKSRGLDSSLGMSLSIFIPAFLDSPVFVSTDFCLLHRYGRNGWAAWRADKIWGADQGEHPHPQPRWTLLCKLRYFCFHILISPFF